MTVPSDLMADDALPEPTPVQVPVPAAVVAAPAKKRHHWIVRLAHWLNAIALTGMIASGLQIYGAFAHFGWKDRLLPVPNPFDSSRYEGFPEAVRLGGWLAGGLDWHFALAWPFVITGLVYAAFLVVSGEWRKLIFTPQDIRPATAMAAYYLRLRKTPPEQGKHNALQKSAYSFIIALGAIATLTGFAIYKPVQLSFLTALFGGFELTRYWHFVSVWLFVGFTIVHVMMVLLADPASLRAIITGTYRGKYGSHD